MLEQKKRIAKIIEDAFVALRFGQDPLENEKHLAGEAADRITAYLEAVGGEPTAWMREVRMANPNLPHRVEITRDLKAVDNVWRHSEHTVSLRSLYTAPQAPAVRVKGLEWNERGFAHTGTGIVYRVTRQPGYWRLEKIEGASTLNSAHPNEDAAKAAAFADYEQRIRSALEAETGGGEPEGVRNTEAGYVEFANFDAPYFVREIDGPSAILFDVATLQIIGYRVYDPATPPDERAVEALREIDLLREVVRTYGDRLRMSNAPMHLQPTIDAALAQGESRNG